MRQENGTELLGADDPRSARIGIIHVTPNDDRKSVLAAIITQDKLGRRQVAVVLPNQNKAFQRPVDFDDLKSMRRRLQTQIVFIAPSGPGPADFARQRRFPVYSTLESYAKALRDDDLEESGGKKERGGRKRWLFGNEAPQAVPLPPRSSVASRSSGEEEDSEEEHASGGPLVASAAAGGAAVGLASGLALDAHNAPRADMHDEDEALPVVPAKSSSGGGTSVQVESDAKDIPDTGNGSGPGIIELPATRTRNTAKLPPMGNDDAALAEAPLVASAPVVPDARPASSTKNARARNGSRAAVAGAAVGAGASVAAVSRSASGSAGSAVRGTPGGRGTQRRTRSRWWLIGLALLLATLLIICAITAYANPALFPSLRTVLPNAGAPATVTLTPNSKTESDSYVITGVTGAPTVSQLQVHARTLSATAQAPAKTVTATGHNQRPARPAVGQLTFSNGVGKVQTISAGLTIDLGNGFSVVTDTRTDIPAGNPGVSFGSISTTAHVTPGGADGNIAPGTIDQICCTQDASVRVRNLQFSGGVNAVDYKFATQADVNTVVDTAKASLIQKASSSLNAQIAPGEQLASSPQCAQKVDTDQPVGDKGTNVTAITVNVSVTCSAQVYDNKALQDLVKTKLQSKASNDLGTSYKLSGNVAVQIKDLHKVNDGTLTLTTAARGVWVYQIGDAQKRDLANKIAGKSLGAAQSILKAQTGVSSASVQTGGNSLPSDAGQIDIQVQGVNGLSGSGTSPMGVPVPTVTDGGSSPTTPVPGNGLIQGRQQQV